MHTKTDGFITTKAALGADTKGQTHLELPKRLFGTWIWISDPLKRSGKSLVLRWRSVGKANDRALEELRYMSNHQLADIGLSRSDLTPEGLAIAGAKRALRQGLMSTKVDAFPAEPEASENGD